MGMGWHAFCELKFLLKHIKHIWVYINLNPDTCRNNSHLFFHTFWNVAFLSQHLASLFVFIDIIKYGGLAIDTVAVFLLFLCACLSIQLLHKELLSSLAFTASWQHWQKHWVLLILDELSPDPCRPFYMNLIGPKAAI